MDTPLKKRRFWQIHLSTAVLLMFVSGGIIVMNAKGRITQEGHLGNNYRVYGWPLDLCLCCNPEANEAYFYRDRLFERSFMRWPYSQYRFLLIAVPYSVLAWMSILMFTARFSEWLLRRREARTP